MVWLTVLVNAASDMDTESSDLDKVDRVESTVAVSGVVAIVRSVSYKSVY